jgi:hypothetical protein
MQVPIEISGFVGKALCENDSFSDIKVCVWSRAPEQKQFSRSRAFDRFSVSIYANGQMLSAKEPKLRQFTWKEQLDYSWSKEVFTRDEVEQILLDLQSLDDFGK